MDASISPGQSPAPQDFAQIFRLIGGYRISQALRVAVELGIPDHLAAGPRHCNDLATTTGSHAPTLYRLLRFLAGAGLLDETSPKQFALTPLGSTLRADIPGSICPVVRLWLRGFALAILRVIFCTPYRLASMPSITHTGRGSSIICGRTPSISAIFNATMTTSSARLANALLKHYDFRGIGRHRRHRRRTWLHAHNNSGQAPDHARRSVRPPRCRSRCFSGEDWRQEPM